MTPWLDATGQRRRLDAAKMLCLAGGMAWVASWFGPLLDVPERISDAVGYVGEGAVLTALLVLVLAIRCPRCKARTTLFYMTKSPVGRWLFDLEDTTSCPSCGHHPDEAGRQ